MKRIAIALLLVLIICSPIKTKADQDFIIYLPLVSKADNWIEFLACWTDCRMQAQVTNEVRKNSLTDYRGTLYIPQHEYLIVFMDVINVSGSEGYVTVIDSFWMIDKYKAVIPMAELDIQYAAQWEYGPGIKTVYDPLESGKVYKMVFVFDMEAGPHELIYRPWKEE